MVLEVAQIDVTPGREAEFADAYRAARDLVASTPGCRWMRMTRGVESRSRFVLLVEWDTIEAHEKNFRESDRFPAWRERIGPYFAAPPVVEHFTDVDSTITLSSEAQVSAGNSHVRQRAASRPSPGSLVAAGSEDHAIGT